MSNRNHKHIRPVTIYLIMFIVSITVFAIFLFFTILSVVNPNGMYKNPNTHIAVFAFVTMVGLVGASLSLRSRIDASSRIKNLRLENTYTLGTASDFYNLEAFKNKVIKMRKSSRHKKMKQYLIVFTPTAITIATNRIKTKEMIELNNEIADFLNKLFEIEDNKFSRNDSVYGFNRGAFLIYLFSGDKEIIQDLVTTISNFIFQTVSSESKKIWAQPFYGVTEINTQSSITAAIEDALIARNVSEHNYESITYYSPVLRRETVTDVDDISFALENNEFVPYFQLKYSLNERKFVSAEALARWDSPKYGVLGPNKFIDKAERAGLLSAIDLDIFEKSVQCISDSLKRGRRIIPISVNFSLYEFFSRNFLDTIVNILQKYQVPPTYIEIEITESTSQSNKFLSLSVINKLKDLGIRVLMDDFGVGYSQIGSLRQIPFDAIKIDKSFTDNILEDEKTRAIMKCIIELAHVNDMEAIIEGVEYKEQVDLLKKMHADTIQGFYYSKAISFKDFNEMLKENEFEKGMKK